MTHFFGLLAIIFSLVMIKKREIFVDMMGSGGGWMDKVGGPYMVVIYIAIIIFLWGCVMLFGLTDSALEPILRLLMPWIFTGNSPTSTSPFMEGF